MGRAGAPHLWTRQACRHVNHHFQIDSKLLLREIMVKAPFIKSFISCGGHFGEGTSAGFSWIIGVFRWTSKVDCENFGWIFTNHPFLQHESENMFLPILTWNLELHLKSKARCCKCSNVKDSHLVLPWPCLSPFHHSSVLCLETLGDVLSAGLVTSRHPPHHPPVNVIQGKHGVVRKYWIPKNWT